MTCSRAVGMDRQVAPKWGGCLPLAPYTAEREERSCICAAAGRPKEERAAQ
jgi:hypothetical protein